MSHFSLYPLLDFGKRTDYKVLDFPKPEERGDHLWVSADSLSRLSEAAFLKIAFHMPTRHLEGLARILASEDASEEERFVSGMLLRNAVIAAEGLLPICQDTGTAMIYGWKGQNLAYDGKITDEEALAQGVGVAYRAKRLRFSQLGPESMIVERNTGDNLPAAIDIRSVPGKEYRFVFTAKGGGSTSRTSLTMESPAILDQERLETAVKARVKALGASGCPPYTISLVLGGASPSAAMYMLELAGLGLLDSLGEKADASGIPLRDREWESILFEAAKETGIGAQWGGPSSKRGSHLAIETKAIRLSRHAANLPFALGVVCSAHRKARAYVSRDGWFLESMEEDPARFLPKAIPVLQGAVKIDLDASMNDWLEKLRSLEAGTTVELSGTVTVARDAAHARLFRMVNSGATLPRYFLDHPVFYAGPTEPAEGQKSGAFGPTTASRMDAYLSRFMDLGACLVTIAKGERSEKARTTIKEHRGVYLACVGGAAAITARNHIGESRIADFQELGMEAVRLVTLENLPAMIVIDSMGIDMYAH
jgi:fumarate hydratase class I